MSSKVELFNKFSHSIYSKDLADVNSPTTDVVHPTLLLNVTTVNVSITTPCRYNVL